MNSSLNDMTSNTIKNALIKSSNNLTKYDNNKKEEILVVESNKVIKNVRNNFFIPEEEIRFYDDEIVSLKSNNSSDNSSNKHSEDSNNNINTIIDYLYLRNNYYDKFGYNCLNNLLQYNKTYNTQCKNKDDMVEDILSKEFKFSVYHLKLLILTFLIFVVNGMQLNIFNNDYYKYFIIYFELNNNIIMHNMRDNFSLFSASLLYSIIFLGYSIGGVIVLSLYYFNFYRIINRENILGISLYSIIIFQFSLIMINNYELYLICRMLIGASLGVIITILINVAYEYFKLCKNYYSILIAACLLGSYIGGFINVLLLNKLIYNNYHDKEFSMKEFNNIKLSIKSIHYIAWIICFAISLLYNVLFNDSPENLLNNDKNLEALNILDLFNTYEKHLSYNENKKSNENMNKKFVNRSNNIYNNTNNVILESNNILETAEYKNKNLINYVTSKDIEIFYKKFKLIYINNQKLYKNNNSNDSKSKNNSLIKRNILEIINFSNQRYLQYNIYIFLSLIVNSFLINTPVNCLKIYENNSNFLINLLYNFNVYNFNVYYQSESNLGLSFRRSYNFFHIVISAGIYILLISFLVIFVNILNKHKVDLKIFLRLNYVVIFLICLINIIISNTVNITKLNNNKDENLILVYNITSLLSTILLSFNYCIIYINAIKLYPNIFRDYMMFVLVVITGVLRFVINIVFAYIIIKFLNSDKYKNNSNNIDFSHITLISFTIIGIILSFISQNDNSYCIEIKENNNIYDNTDIENGDLEHTSNKENIKLINVY